MLADTTANLCAQADALAAKIAARGPAAASGRVRAIQRQCMKLVAQIERNVRALGLKKTKSAPTIADYLANRA